MDRRIYGGRFAKHPGGLPKRVRTSGTDGVPDNGISAMVNSLPVPPSRAFGKEYLIRAGRSKLAANRAEVNVAATHDDTLATESKESNVEAAAPEASLAGVSK